ncbi:hypothetical protein RWE15_21780 [Virgibacillus halophilus]|uniref:Uncharacterized protein n=1 Tax=Tigheibacillus halophilus TaxID=361280 RepID=A0ABU5CB40_9BACI|nr:hypothetical protein [Virgibacillus halophilus]
MSQETRSGAQNVNPAASLLGKVAVTGFVGGIFLEYHRYIFILFQFC